MSYLPQQSVTSTSNNTTTPLSGSATFTGTGEQSPYSDVMCSCYSDTAGTLYFDFSVDNTNWRTFPTSGFAVAAGIHEFHTAVKGPRYFRVRFVNGSSAQSTFQLYCYFGSFRQPNAPLNQPLGLDADAILVRPTFEWLDIARGLQNGITVVKKFGRNQSVGTNYEPISISGIYNTPQSGSATTLRVKSGNTNDTAAGTGARTVTLEGLDENFDIATETLTTAGTSASSASTTTFTRLYRAFVATSGTYATSSAGSHAGDITIENGSGGTDWLTIDSTDFPKAQSEVGAYSVPRNYSAYVFFTDITINTGKTVDLVFFERDNIDETSAPYTAMRAKAVFVGLDGGLINNKTGARIPIGKIQGPSDICFMAKVSTGTAEVSVEFEIFLVAE